MDYEIFYEALQPQEKAVKESLASLQKLFKAVGRKTESGDVKGMLRDIAAMAEAAASIASSIEELKNVAEGFDSKSYFESGEFADQMLAACQEQGVDVRGDFPVYEMFPYRVRLDVENQDVYLDRKKISCMRPKNFVATVKSGQEKLNRAYFNASTFVNELAGAYDLVVMKQKRQPGADVSLNSIYKFLAPMSRYRKDYDQNSFAFDLARLRNSEDEQTKDGRRFQYGTSRNNGKAIRILDKNGREEFFSTIRFYKSEDEEVE